MFNRQQSAQPISLKLPLVGLLADSCLLCNKRTDTHNEAMKVEAANAASRHSVCLNGPCYSTATSSHHQPATAALIYGAHALADLVLTDC
jgi:hypothetical protein